MRPSCSTYLRRARGFVSHTIGTRIRPSVARRPPPYPDRFAVQLDKRREDLDQELGSRVRPLGSTRERDLAGRRPSPAPDGSRDDPAGRMMRGTSAGGVGTPEAIAHAAVYLASDEASFVHGKVIDVDGGLVGVAVIASQ